MIAVGFGLWYLLFCTWIKVSSSIGSTCKTCGSNKSEVTYYGRLGFAETNKLDRITFRGKGFETCLHKWEPGYTPIDKGTSNQVLETNPESDAGAIPGNETSSQGLKDKGFELSGMPATVDGAPAVKIENTGTAPLLAPLLTLDWPTITVINYAITGEIKYENVQGAGYLEMWSHFQSAGKYFSRTLGAPGSGPMAVISGSSAERWRAFILPFDRTGTRYSVSKLEVNLYLPGKGVVYLRKVKLVELKTKIEGVPPTKGTPPGLTAENVRADKAIEFGGVTWMAWHTPFELQGDKLVSLPKARPGFSYGHGGNGRGAILITHVGNTDWRNYSVTFTFCMTGVNPAFNPHRLPMDYRGGNISFHIANAKESWNERGSSGYGLNINADGSWTLGCGYNSYSASSSGWFSPKNDGTRTLAQGKGIKLDFVNGNRYRIDVIDQRINIWVDDVQIVDVTDEKMSEKIGGIRLDHGGVSVNGGFECMIWLSDFSKRQL